MKITFHWKNFIYRRYLFISFKSTTNHWPLSLTVFATTDTDKCKKCDKSILRLEEIDDDADQHKIGFVKIQDKKLAFEYGLEVMPALVYYRKKIPIVYDGELIPSKEWNPSLPKGIVNTFSYLCFVLLDLRFELLIFDEWLWMMKPCYKQETWRRNKKYWVGCSSLETRLTMKRRGWQTLLWSLLKEKAGRRRMS